METEHSERRRNAEARSEAGKVPWEHMTSQPGAAAAGEAWPGVGLGQGGLAEAEMTALISRRPASPLSAPARGTAGHTGLSVWSFVEGEVAERCCVSQSRPGRVQGQNNRKRPGGVGEPGLMFRQSPHPLCPGLSELTLFSSLFSD